MTSTLAGEHLERASRWIYDGVWGVLVRWFRVPKGPPVVPCLPGDELESFRPSAGFLRYLKLQYWLTLGVIGAPLAIGCIIALVLAPRVMIPLAPLILALMAVPAVAAYLAIHLRYDTTWYVMTGRSLRIRRGIWILHETTITFENVQNVEVNQGPLQRWFGIADVKIDTAGGGSPQPGAHGAAAGAGHRGLIEGVHNAPHIRDLILSRLRHSKSAGLGDEPHPAASALVGWSPAQVALLREIRDAARSLATHAAA
ncbi:MAG TPA: PH domain-containing protein [Pirellulales bacterium]|nr:PH domain-containing protein [Pirellulales bacterium]